MKEIKTISVKCDTKDTLNIAEMTELQGKLKARNDVDYDKIKLSIIKYGFSFPFFVWKSDKNYILDGHGRFETLCRMQKDGYLIPDVPVVFVEAKDLKEAKQKLLRLNSQYGKMTKESVLEFAEDIDLNFDEIALPDSVIDFTDATEPQETEGDDEVPEVDEKSEPVSKRGEMYELGNSILMCGDSTNAEDVARLMGGEKADLVFTDPPYGMKKENEGVLNDNLNFDDLLEFNKKWIALSFEHLKDVGSWYCWGIDEPLMDIYSNILKPMAKENKITFRNIITWDKGSGQGENSEDYRMYAIADEKCLFVMAGVQGFNTNADHYFEGWEPIRDYLLNSRLAMGWDVPTMKRIVGHSDLNRDHWTSKSQFNMPTREVYDKMKAEAERQRKEKGIENDAFKREYDDIKREYYKTRAYFNNTDEIKNNVWHFKRISAEERKTTGGHATPKPLELCERAINTSSRKGELVLDFFGGSGSTLIASEKLGRKCRMIELDERYCDVIRRRYTQFAKLNGLKITSGCLE
jgi:DNA modification methylase